MSNAPIIEVEPEPPPPVSTFRSYLQLLRLPNVFTALADVAMGYLVVRPGDVSAAELALLLIASAALYSAGMVLNDVADYEVDSRERPQRPLPSGRISLRAADRLGWLLMVIGLLCGAAAVPGQASWLSRSALTSVGLVLAIVTYDLWLKRTILGPLGMGLCRALNVLLGMSAAAEAWLPVHYQIAASLGIYIVGVTWFAKREAEESNPAKLALAIVIMLAGIAGLGWATRDFPYAVARGPLWMVFWGLLAMTVAQRVLRAVFDPSPATVQQGVKHAILSLIILDAAAAFGSAGQAAIWILVLLPPALLLGRWVYST